MQTSDENKYKYQSGDYYSIQNQIPYRGKEGAALNHYQFWEMSRNACSNKNGEKPSKSSNSPS